MNSAEVSPDGTLVAGDQILPVSDGDRVLPGAAILLAETATGETVFCQEFGTLSIGDQRGGGGWLADGSGFVAALRDETRPAGFWYAVVQADGSSYDWLPTPPMLSDGPWHREPAVLAPAPSPDDPNLFAYGRSVLFDGASGDWHEAVLPDGPAHASPWGRAAMRW